jgi:putative methionine-R-sulfoxide reductase with GAF domain
MRQRGRGAALGCGDSRKSLEHALDDALSQGSRTARRDDPFLTLTKITACAVHHVPSVDHAGITVVDGDGVIRSVAPTDGYPLVLDNIQRRFLEGPCYEAAAAKEALLVDDLALEPRWPSFVNKALGSTSVRAIVALPIFDDDGAHAALNLYADRARVFGATTQEAGSRVVQYLERVMTTGRRRKPLRALTSGSDRVSAAKQMLMQRFGIDSVEALSVLVSMSRRQQISLQALSQSVLDGQRHYDRMRPEGL